MQVPLFLLSLTTPKVLGGGGLRALGRERVSKGKEAG